MPLKDVQIASGLVAALAGAAALLTVLPAAIPSVQVLVDAMRARVQESSAEEVRYGYAGGMRGRMLLFMGMYVAPAAVGGVLGAIALGLARTGAGSTPRRGRAAAGAFVLLALAYVPLGVAFQCTYRACEGWLDTQKVRGRTRRLSCIMAEGERAR